eukprot:586397-Prorocentrum_minimum.AAC.2
MESLSPWRDQADRFLADSSRPRPGSAGPLKWTSRCLSTPPCSRRAGSNRSLVVSTAVLTKYP